MSKETVRTNGEQAEGLEIIREECSPALSSVNMNAIKVLEPKHSELCIDCACLENNIQLKENLTPAEVEMILKQKEKELTANFQAYLEKEVTVLKERCEFILQNEQVRASHMLREAHRERQEKISALQAQLQCKNLAGLMYVMCSEKRKSKLEKLKITEEYTNYIHALQDILSDAQTLILYLSRGYKTAARVDQEWRQKMKKVLSEFQMFIHDFAKGTPESDQFFFDLPMLLKTEATIEDNPEEDPCEDNDKIHEQQDSQQEGRADLQEDNPWYDQLDSECRPFVVFGDMAEFKPPQRRDVLRTVKAAKTAPRKWKNYVFNEMFVKADCANLDTIKDDYTNRLPVARWECQTQPELHSTYSKQSIPNRRVTTASVDIRGNMGSILKMITTAGQPQNKATLLGARDSMEIASTTKLRERHKQSDHSRVVINVGSRRASIFEAVELDEEFDVERKPSEMIEKSSKLEEEEDESLSALGSIHNDSLLVITAHVPDQDHKINYEKICPMEKCQRMQVDSFVRSLPPYMRANPFTHFEQTYEDYEACTPEQLEVLKQRIEERNKKERGDHDVAEENPLQEWTSSVEGMGVQTSDVSMSLPPCTCRVPNPSLASSTGHMFNVEELIPMKQALDKINKECFYDSRIMFDRFKVIRQDSNDSLNPRRETKKDRLQEITKVLKQHPSLLDIFQANTV